jgi:uncharacterized protein (TIGR04255 family)
VPTLSQAPLLEVVTQVRWGVAERDSAGALSRYVFTEHERENLLPALARVLARAGFTESSEIPLDDPDDIEFIPALHFHRQADEWPVLSAGIGVLSVHQRNEGYKWTEYKHTVGEAFALLLECLTDFYDNIPFVGVELSYLDAFFLEEDEEPYQFLRDKLAVSIAPSPEFFGAPFLEREPTSADLAFDFRLSEPAGLLGLSLEVAEIYGKVAYTMDTRVRSLGHAVEYSQQGLYHWLELAHQVQKHTFRTLIQPAYLKSLE